MLSWCLEGTGEQGCWQVTLKPTEHKSHRLTFSPAERSTLWVPALSSDTGDRVSITERGFVLLDSQKSV
jgi:hypothetical protein